MPIARPEPQDARVIAHIDMDCFYVQVEQRKRPELRGLPSAVVQYNSWKGGGLIAVSYEARKFGVKRSMRGDDAKKVCPNIQLIQVPVARGKADLNLYRNAGSEVVSILSRKGRCERASIDEVYLDLTDAAESMLSENPLESLEVLDEEVLKSHILGLTEDQSDKKTVEEWLCRSDADRQDKLLACGAIIVAELRMDVLKETMFTCSAGIAHNKMLAKLASAMHKPAQQTVVPSSSVQDLLASLPVKKMKQLGGKLGSSLQSDLGVTTVGDLLQFSEGKLQDRYGVNTGPQCTMNLHKLLDILTVNSPKGFIQQHSLTLEVQDNFPTMIIVICDNDPASIPPLSLDDAVTWRSCRHWTWLWNIARGISGDEVEGRLLPKSHGCGKTFPGPKALKTIASVEHWLNELSEELNERLQSDLDQNKRVAQTLTLHARAYKCNDLESDKKFPSKSCPLRYGTAKIQEDTLRLFDSALREFLGSSRVESQGNRNKTWGVTSLSISASKILATPAGTSILKFFHVGNPSCSSSKQESDEFLWDSVSLSILGSEGCLGRNQVEQQGGPPHQEEDTMNPAPSAEQAAQRSETWEYKIEEQGGPLHQEEDTMNPAPITEQVVQRSETWEYKIEDIDPSVIDELPPEIQQEVRGWIRPHKRANTAKKGSSIAYYFSPIKRS